MSSASLVITPTPLIRSNHFRDFLGLVVASRYSKAPNLGFSLLVGLSGLEPPTSRLSGVRSNRLSYKPMVVEMRRVELLTPCLQGRCSPS